MKVVYRREGGITREHIASAVLYVFGQTVYGTDGKIHDMDVLELAIEHFKFLKRYGL